MEWVPERLQCRSGWTSLRSPSGTNPTWAPSGGRQRVEGQWWVLVVGQGGRTCPATWTTKGLESSLAEKPTSKFSPVHSYVSHVPVSYLDSVLTLSGPSLHNVVHCSCDLRSSGPSLRETINLTQGVGKTRSQRSNHLDIWSSSEYPNDTRHLYTPRDAPRTTLSKLLVIKLSKGPPPMAVVTFGPRGSSLPSQGHTGCGAVRTN